MEVLLKCVPHFTLTVHVPEQPTPSLHSLSPHEVVAPGGQTIADRMEKLCKAGADDIDKCAKACDTYLT